MTPGRARAVLRIVRSEPSCSVEADRIDAWVDEIAEAFESPLQKEIAHLRQQLRDLTNECERRGGVLMQRFHEIERLEALVPNPDAPEDLAPGLRRAIAIIEDTDHPIARAIIDDLREEIAG